MTDAKGSGANTHVVPSVDGGWSVRKHGSTRATRTFASQQEAVSFGRKMARSEGAELVIHRRDGSVQSWNSYANDSRPAKN